ncbi:WD40 repeat domain-containing protein [Rhodopirellula halodulae]|uniref:WD40 repeat domain-containing protein n=1 Tax=Rhodopirellula halodulae TaxID=2894198 RepID=UPI001E3986AC|nr:WD40 repeat domain-containing protein [Rhodopirellula sp. JC737]MCC9656855.1 WD40 repeat domain-containing protein [Rhodopirellula sp. JC737]
MSLASVGITAFAQPPATAPTMRIAGKPTQLITSNDLPAARIVRLPPVDDRVKQVVVTALAIDPRGEWLAVAGDDHVIRLVHQETLKVVKTLGDGHRSQPSPVGHSDMIRTLAFDASGSRLASAGNDGRLIIWDRNEQFSVLQEIGSAPALACVNFSPSGHQLVAVGFDKEVFLISNQPTQNERLMSDCNDLRCGVYRHDGQALAVAGRDGHVHLFDPNTGKQIADQHLHTRRVRDLDFMPGSDVLVSVDEDGVIIRWDTKRDEVLSRQKITTGRLFSLAIVDEQRFAAAGSDDVIHLVDIGTDGQTLFVSGQLRGHVGSVATLAAVDGMVYSGGFDATLRRWDLSPDAIADSKIALGSDATTPANEPTPR